MALEIPGEVGAPIVSVPFLQINWQKIKISNVVHSLNREGRSRMYRTKSSSVMDGKKSLKSILRRKLLAACAVALSSIDLCFRYAEAAGCTGRPSIAYARSHLCRPFSGFEG